MRRRWASELQGAHELGAAGCVAAVEVFDDDNGEAVEIGCEHGHGCAEEGGEKEAGYPDGHLRDHEVGEDLIRLGH